jgi:hypothetical protein
MSGWTTWVQEGRIDRITAFKKPKWVDLAWETEVALGRRNDRRTGISGG